MTITREQVADLQPGDVVRYRRDEWAEGSFVQGPVSLGEHPSDKGLYVLEGSCCVRHPDGRVYEPAGEITVVSRAPRPLYVNHPRTEPAPGDVVRDAGSDDPTCWDYIGDHERPWGTVGVIGWHTREAHDSLPTPLRLLVDGETGQVVP